VTGRKGNGGAFPAAIRVSDHDCYRADRITGSGPFIRQTAKLQKVAYREPDSKNAIAKHDSAVFYSTYLVTLAFNMSPCQRHVHEAGKFSFDLQCFTRSNLIEAIPWEEK
jgi:hypothetical protein